MMTINKEQAKAALALRQLAGQIESSEEEIKFTRYFHYVDSHDVELGGMVVDKIYVGSSIVIHIGQANDAMLTECLVKQQIGTTKWLGTGRKCPPGSSSRPVPTTVAVRDGHCICKDSDEPCHLGKASNSQPCSVTELVSGGVSEFVSVEHDPDMIPRVGPPDGLPRLGCGTLAVPGMTIYGKDGSQHMLLYCDQLGNGDNFRCRYSWDSEYAALTDFTALPPSPPQTAESLLCQCEQMLQDSMCDPQVDRVLVKIRSFLKSKE